MRIAYFDCIAGISGEMALGALLDAGADLGVLRTYLAELPLGPFDLDVEEVEQHGIRALRVHVRTVSGGVIRTYPSMRSLLDAAALPQPVSESAHRILRRLAAAEAAVHRKEIEAVTFHDAEAVAILVEVVGTSLALSQLEVDLVHASAVPTGLGMTRTEHGVMPIPSPTVVELLRGAPIYSKGVSAELTTGTGAAILAGTAQAYGELPPLRIHAVGYGAGVHRLDFPDVLRVLIGEGTTVRPTDLGG